MESIKQTAVNYLIHSINEDMFQLSKSEAEWKEIFEQAKEIEKEQIIESYKDSTCQFSVDSRIDCPKSAEQYFNEKYGK